VKEVNRVRDVGDDKSQCGCMNITTLGLPCACELSKTVRARVTISLEVIHIHWTRFSLDEVDFVQESRSTLSLEPEWQLYKYKI
jgi:hypothetical protein